MTAIYAGNTRGDISTALVAQGATTVNLTANQDAKWPAISGDDESELWLSNADESTYEILTVIGHVVGSNTLTVSAAKNNWPIGSKLECRESAGKKNELSRMASGIAPEVESLLGFPVKDLGPFIFYKGRMIRRIKTPFGESRYSVGNCRLTSENLIPRITNNVTTQQNVAQIRIPGGAITPGTAAQLVIGFAQFLVGAGTGVNFNTSNVRVGVTFIQTGFSSSLTFKTDVNSAASSGSTTLNIIGLGPNWLQATGMDTYTSPNIKRINLLNDWTIRISLTFSNGDGTKYMTVAPVLTIQDSEPFMDPDASNYRSAAAQPFNNRSHWNEPIKAGVVLDTGLLTAALRDSKYGGASAVNNFTWISGGNDAERVNVYQADKSDPIMTFTYESTSYGAWFMENQATTGGTFTMHGSPVAYAPGQTSDAIVIIRTPDKRFLIEGGRYRFVDGVHKFGYLNVVDLFDLGRSVTLDATPFQEQYRASGFPLIGGLVTGADLASGVIQHAVSMQFDGSIMKAARYTPVNIVAGSTLTFASTLSSLKVNYTPNFPIGTKLYYGSVEYTTTSEITYDGATGNNTVSVTPDVVVQSGVQIALGGTNTQSQKMTQYVWPATNCDGASLNSDALGYHGVVPVGALVTIDQSLTPQAAGLTTPEGTALFNAIKNFGAYVADFASGTASICYVDSSVTPAQLAGLNTDKNKIRAVLSIATNSNRYQPGGPGAPVVSYPKPLYPLYNGSFGGNG